MQSNNNRPYMSKDELQHKYNKFAPNYDQSERFLAYLGVRKLRKGLLENVSGKILDVACGTGSNFAFFPKDSYITAIDMSPGMMAFAREQASKLELQVEFHLMDAEKLDFPDHSFDTVVSTLSTCTFPDPIAALHEMKRVCHPDGRIVLLEHGLSKWHWLASIQHRLAHRHFKSAGCRWNQEPQDLIAEAGLNIISSKRALFGIFHAIEAS